MEHENWTKGAIKKISFVICRLLHSEEFTQCKQNTYHRVFTRRVEAIATAGYPELKKKKVYSYIISQLTSL